jgi:hypothetical protein
VDDDVEVVVLLDVVETNVSGDIRLAFEGKGWGWQAVKRSKSGWLEAGVENMEDIVQ